MVLRKEGYKDMDKFLVTRNAQRKRYYMQTQKYEPRSWNDDDIHLILNSPKSDRELSDILQRSISAIQGQRCLKKHKKIDALLEVK